MKDEQQKEKTKLQEILEQNMSCTYWPGGYRTLGEALDSTAPDRCPQCGRTYEGEE